MSTETAPPSVLADLASKETEGLRHRHPQNMTEEPPVDTSDKTTPNGSKENGKGVEPTSDGDADPPYRRKRLKSFSHTYLVHTAIRASPLSKESPEQNYRGFFNLAMLLLAVSNLRLIIENYVKYGFLLSLPFSGVPTSELTWNISWAVVSFMFQGAAIYASYRIEKWATADPLPDRPTRYRVKILHTVNITLLISIPTAISWFCIDNPAISSLPLFAATVLFLKLISYALVCADLRREHAFKIFPKREEDEGAQQAKLKHEEGDVPFTGEEITYPDNITFSNMLYFIFVPTLSYQPSYPRTPRFRFSFFIKRLFELTTGVAAMYLIGAQYAAPTLRNSLQALDKMDLVRVAERVLKLSVVSVVMWLLLFWCFFHCLLNILAEVLRFGDRRFYLHWWNAKDIAEYWRLWNTPVYNWGKRHIYLPLMINHKIPSWVGMLVIFTISAVLHELIIGVPTHCLKGWAFGGMMFQIPLIYLTQILVALRKRYFKNEGRIFDTIGNLIFWISFTIVGQPTCILLYYSVYTKVNCSEFRRVALALA
ncbi:hypothetical protein HK104_010780 [Borealophlyctis nickersoniae]|nr:hypothetical protein HK104_010780 [Borealophlyctis nickersoniae]